MGVDEGERVSVEGGGGSVRKWGSVEEGVSMWERESVRETEGFYPAIAENSNSLWIMEGSV